MRRQIDLTGHRFGRLTVTGPADIPRYWKVVCDCGNERTVLGSSMRSGNTKSCGCLTRLNPGRPCANRMIPIDDFVQQCGMQITHMRAYLIQHGVIVDSHGMYTALGRRYGPYPSPVHALAMAIYQTVTPDLQMPAKEEKTTTEEDAES
jgi:hypothetical protein